MIHVYALTDRAGPVLELVGIDERPLELRAAGAVAAVVSRHDEAPQPSAEALLRHAAVVEAASEHRAVLPARFGSGVPDERAVDDLLGDPGLPARLDRVRGRIEVDVRLVVPEVAAAGAQPAVHEPGKERTGREHLRALAARSVAAGSSASTQQAAVEAVRARLECFAEAIADRPPGSPRVLRHIALLLDRGALTGFGQAVAELAADLAPAYTVLCTGPWPPYNFVDATPQAQAPEVAR